MMFPFVINRNIELLTITLLWMIIYLGSMSEPDLVTNLECRAVENHPSILVVDWEAPSEENGAIKGYVVNYTLIDRGNCGQLRYYEDTGIGQVLSDDTAITLRYLHSYSVYNISVQAKTSAGEGEPVFVSCTTEETAPEKPPPNVRAISSTSRSLEFRWDPVPCEFANGIITHYEYIVVLPQDIYPAHLQLRKRSLDVFSPNLSLHVVEGLQAEIKNLQPGTQYGFRVRGVNRAGSGFFSNTLFEKAKEDIPGEPSKISVVDNGLRTLNVIWREPIRKNGAVLGYKISYIPVMTLDPVFNATPFTGRKTEVNDQVQEVALADLYPSTEYEISVAAKTSAGYGPQVSVRSWTVILGDHVSPSLRTLGVEVTNETIPIAFSTIGSTSVYKYQIIVEYARNRDPIDENLLRDYDTAVVKNGLPYYIAAELDPRNVSRDGEQSFIVGDKRIWGGYENVHLNPGYEYKIRIRILVFKDDEIKAVLSEPEKETTASMIVEVDSKYNQKTAGLDFLPFILILIGLLVFVLAVIFLTVCMIRRWKKKYSSFSTHEFGRSESLTWSDMYRCPQSESCGGPIVNDEYRTLPISEKHASPKETKSLDNRVPRGIRIDTLQDFLVNALATKQLADEFQKLVERQTSPWTIARKSSNVMKNRYGNVLPYDRHRVVLQSNSKEESDYINASYVDGYRRSREYIITQGPLDHTVNDFWRMVWQESSPVIVMVTQLVENGKEKCSKYWPDDSMMSGDIQILLIHSEECPDFIVRTLLMRQLDEVSTHRVMQYQYTAWSDRTVPLNTNYFIKFLKRVRDDHPVMGGPMIVHCRYANYLVLREYCRICNKHVPAVYDHWTAHNWMVVPNSLQELDEVVGIERYCPIRPSRILILHHPEVSTHRVMQYQYTAWSDRTVPLNTNYFIKFLKRVRDDHPVMGGQMIVHCSAGAGRSGTYVAIDALCQQAAEEKRVDVYRYVNNARHQRTHLVQTLKQYKFIYEALVEAYEFEDTAVSLDKIGTYLKELSHMSTLDQTALILRQYNKLNRTQKKVESNRCSVALSENNIFRNRDPLIVPMDAARIVLNSEDQTDELSDYINAVYVNGYRKKKRFLATQMPLTHTVEDFWRMIYLNKSSLIVMLNGSDETDDLNVGIYWPELGDCSYGDFDVQIITFEEQGDFITRLMKLSYCENENEEPHKVIQLQYKGWTSEMKPASVLELIKNVEIAYQKSSGGPITVHCMDGATRTGLFIAAKNLCDKIRTEGVLDAYQIVKSIRTNRPEFIPNSDQYRFLFEIAQEFVSA